MRRAPLLQLVRQNINVSQAGNPKKEEKQISSCMRGDPNMCQFYFV